MFRISQTRATNPLSEISVFQIALALGVDDPLALGVALLVARSVPALFVELELLASAGDEGLMGEVDVFHVCFLSFSRRWSGRWPGPA